MKNEISEALLDFYEEMLAPEFSGFKKALLEQEERFISVLGHFDSVYKRFDRLEDEYYTITHGMKRIEGMLGGDIEDRGDIRNAFMN